jgi:hypothetical protein
VLAGMPDTEFPQRNNIGGTNNGGHVVDEAPAAMSSAPDPTAPAIPAISATPVRPAINDKQALSVDRQGAANELDSDVPAIGDDEAPTVRVEEGPVHRPLIRATLPRVEGHKEVRQVPDFTVRHRNGGRDNAPFRGDRAQVRGAAGAGNGGRPNGRRFSGGGSGSPSGAPGRGGSPSRGGGGFRGANGPQRPGGNGPQGGPRGKKRSR